MIHASRVEAFVKLGEEIENLPSREWRFLVESVQQNNPWFNEDAVALALRNIRKFLTRASIRKWLGSYDLENDRPLNIGVVMAGNIPAVGFHDLLCILISGNRIKAKLSSQDGVLLPFLKEKLIRIAPEFEAFISFVHLIKNVDAVIATGTDNTSRYFEYYFSSMPRIIRKNRTSIAVLRGDENKEDLNKLGHDTRIMAAKYVGPYRTRGKNDLNDAVAICDAVQRPNSRFIPAKSPERRVMRVLHQKQKFPTD